MITVHFINNSGEDIYVSLSDETSARILCEQLRLLEVPADIVLNI